MNNHLVLLVNAFYAASAALVTPSFVVLVLYALHCLRAWFTPMSASHQTLKNPDAVLLVLGAMSRVVGALAGVLGFLQHFVLNAIAILALIILAVGIGLFFIGRGLHDYATWARITAAVMIAAVCLSGVASVLSARGPLFGASVVAIACSLYGMWVLWQKFPS